MHAHRSDNSSFQRVMGSIKTPAGVSVIALFALSVYAIITFLPTAVKPPDIKAKLLISSIPSGAKITIDGQDTGRLTNAELDGYTIGHQHVIQVSLKGYETQEKAITLNGLSVDGQPVEVRRRFFMRRSKGSLSVGSSPPGAEIYLDGRYVGVTPKVIRQLERQKDQMLLHIKKDGFRSKKVTLSWGDKDRLKFDATLEPSKR